MQQSAEQPQRFFPQSEYEGRRERVRQTMAERGLDALLIASPENIYYLCGLDHMGYFAYQLLVLPQKGDPVLVTRAMEKATVRDQVPDVAHVGYSDGSQPEPPQHSGPDDSTAILDPGPAETGTMTRDVKGVPPQGTAAIRATCRAISDLGLANGQLGLEMGTTFLPYAIAHGIRQGLAGARWTDVSGLVDDCRILQSPLELECTRAAASISDSMLLGAISASTPGMHHRDIMAAIYHALFRQGGTYPGFVPLVRSTATLDHEHGTWQDARLEPGDVLFLEMSGCTRRYHAPMGRLVFLGGQPGSAARMNAICQEAQSAAADAIRPGVQAGDVYAAWQDVVNGYGLGHYRRHHCGYSVGIGYPPSWSGSGVPVGLRPGSEMTLKTGMVFHLMSWLLRSGEGDAFLSDTIVVTDDGCEFLTTTARDVIVR